MAYVRTTCAKCNVFDKKCTNNQQASLHCRRRRRAFCCALDDASSVRTNRVAGSCAVRVLFFFNLAHAHFILKMAAVQGGLVDANEEKDIKSEPANDTWANNNANDGRLPSASPGASAAAGGNKTAAVAAAAAPEDQQTLLAVLQFLRKNKLTESVEILRREAGLPEDSLESKGADSFCGDQECYYGDDLRILSSLSKREHMRGNETLLDFRTSKFVLRISRDSYQLLKRHLQERQNNQIWNIIQEHLYIDIFDGIPRSKGQIDAMSGSLAGEAKREANKAKVYYGLLKEPEIELPLDDEDEEAENEEGKPKKKKPKKDSMGSKSKKQDPNAPAQTRIPLPELKDSDKLDKIMYMKEATKKIRLGPDNLPSICFYSFLNAYQGLTAVDFTDDSSLIAGGFADSTVRVWSVTPKKLRKVKSAADLNLIDKESDDVLERIMDEKTASESKILHGHSGPVYGISFSPDRNYLLSSSEDGTIRLWSLLTFTCLVGYKGHNYPVWDTQFSPHGYYFISGGHDRVARLWATDHYQPLRMFSGHLADITCTRFHPNSNYVATGSSDRTIRLWDVLNGNCVRIFTGHKGPIHTLAFSPNGKFLASGATDGRVLLWDIGHGLMIGELKGHTDTVYSLRFSRDGEILASGSMDNTVRLWDATKAFDDLETDDFTAATGHIHLQDNSQELLLGTYMTKSTPVIHLHFTRRNLLLAAGAYNP
ncbi:putative transcription initiation factor TFIID subunit 5 [Scophthalmus maximus]|uniref:Transcription initiation factor TFIID subunit 5 n=1 Tax=Scophthalmus maximus TaxID=52904 RepID=A0A2U9BPQ9_SCOMX|nr:putative transcription initiation factor TFIID subunit 5 [Scophthalmus maximus]